MSLAADLAAKLKLACERVFPDEAPLSTEKPYVTYQFFGGPSLQTLAGQMAENRRQFCQVNVWAASRADSLTVALAIEAGLSTNTVFTAQPDGDLLWNHDSVPMEDAPDGIYSTQQSWTLTSR